MATFLKGPKMSIIWTVLRIWLGIQWIEAGFNKITSGFDATGFIQGASPGAKWYGVFFESFAVPNAELFNILIPWGEFLVGLGLILGAATIPALVGGAFMNFNFLMVGAGAVDVIFYTTAFILILTGRGSYYYGVDRFAIPYVKEMFNKRKVRTGKVGVTA
jgi:thiosulfate dehydrogenase (quinone) large subunit